MKVRTLSLAVRLAGLMAMACLSACHPAAPDRNEQDAVRQSFEAFKAALAARQAQQAIGVLDQPTRDYLQASVTSPLDPSAPDEEVRELVRQAAAKLTPGGIRPGFKLETPLQRVLNAGWINAQDIGQLGLGPVTVEGGQAHAEVMWQDQPTTLELVFVRESGEWKIDLLKLVSYANLALRMDRTVKGQTETEQVARLVAQVPAL